jgi:hypothetical protein
MTADGDGDGLPLQLPPGQVWETDVRMALALWAYARNITHAIAVREDTLEQITIWIEPLNDGDWAWMQDEQL